MAERLVVLSDMWGTKKGLWITSYLGYLQQYYDIVFYDCQQLANINETIDSEENVHNAFIHGGIDTAVAHLLKKETIPSHYLAFSTGGTIAWKAGLKGLPVRSLYAVSATRLRNETQAPDCDVTLLYGATDSFKPDMHWQKSVGIEPEMASNFGHDLYTDEKIIQKVCQDILKKVVLKKVV
ncbi:hypothetical protein HYG79_03760 [Costertonia aggregata]|uniref:Alpha/beta hydrolase n=2 Tax=Costertonia aggregata TaxID=343403 RepID=A0A7H9AUX2_9FLAO|nr:hypothetical protein HYG79_03760 [Costertonia aggregata]